jgi:hypothetical protein
VCPFVRKHRVLITMTLKQYLHTLKELYLHKDNHHHNFRLLVRHEGVIFFWRNFRSTIRWVHSTILISFFGSRCHLKIWCFWGWTPYTWISQNPHKFHRTQKSLRVCTSAEHNSRVVAHKYSVSAQHNTTVSCCVAHATRIVLQQKHDYVVTSSTWRWRTTIGVTKFRILKIINLFDSTSFVYLKNLAA